MRIAFRVDASPRIGAGHYVRCLTLARELKSRGATICFLSSEVPANLLMQVRSEGFEYADLPSTPSSTGEAQDASASVAVLAEQAAWDWIVVDHYQLGFDWERQLRLSLGTRVLVIDDLANREHDCDVLLDQNLFRDLDERYNGLLPARCSALLGPRFALLASVYRERRRTAAPAAQPPQRILVTFGGADVHAITVETVRALSAPEFDALQVDIVYGGPHPQVSELQALTAGRTGVSIHPSQPHLADLIFAADLVIGAGGATTWERMCLGRPALVVTLAENQEALAEWLHELGFIHLLGSKDAVDAAAISAAVRAVIQNGHGQRIGDAAALCDGEGARRVVDLMQEVMWRPADQQSSLIN